MLMSADRAAVDSRLLQLIRIPLKCHQEFSHAINGVHAAIRPRTVARTARRLNRPPNNAFMSMNDFQMRRLGDNRKIGLQTLNQALHAEKRVFLIDRAAEDDVRSPVGRSRNRRANAISMAVMPPFTSQAPRP